MPSLPTQEISYEEHFQNTLEEGRAIVENSPGPLEGILSGGEKLGGEFIHKFFVNIMWAILMFPLFFIVGSSVGPVGTIAGVLAYLWFLGNLE